MYCRNCSNEVSFQAIACSKCGVPPMRGKNFCHNCGAETHPDAIICVACGVGFKKSGDTISVISIWSKYSYSTYIIIILFSLLSFIDFKCVGTRVESVTGLNMAVGAERTYTKTNPNKYEKYGMQPYGYQKYTDETESLFSWDIALFYLLIIITLVALLTNSPRRFKTARGFTIASLVILVEWFIVVSIRINKESNRAVDISFGIGFWFTLLITILSLLLLSIYLNQNKIIDNIPDALFTPSVHPEEQPSIMKKSPNIIEEGVLPTQNIEALVESNEQETSAGYQLLLEQEKNVRLNKHMTVTFWALSIIIIVGMIWGLSKSNPSESPTISSATEPVTNDSSSGNLTDNDKQESSQINTNSDTINSTYKIINAKAYFYNSPNESTIRRGYLLQDAIIQGCCLQSGFVRTRFTNTEGQTSEGFIKMEDLEVAISDTAFFNGTKKFCDEENIWSYTVTVFSNKIELKLYPGLSNTTYPDKSKAKEIIKGTINQGKILTNDAPEYLTNRFKFTNGILYEVNNEGGSNEYKQCGD